ncbi:hypothetical protein ACLMAB_17440 [Brevibacillus laterosporus]
MELDRYQSRKSGHITYTPVYKYGNNSARFLDANSGEAISPNGAKAEASNKIIPLGDQITYEKIKHLQKSVKSKLKKLLSNGEKN